MTEDQFVEICILLVKLHFLDKLKVSSKMINMPPYIVGDAGNTNRSYNSLALTKLHHFHTYYSWHPISDSFSFLFGNIFLVWFHVSKSPEFLESTDLPGSLSAHRRHYNLQTKFFRYTEKRLWFTKSLRLWFKSFVKFL